jgi:hypothetical protein
VLDGGTYADPICCGGEAPTQCVIDTGCIDITLNYCLNAGVPCP